MPDLKDRAAGSRLKLSMGLIKREKAWNRAQTGSQCSPRQGVVLISVMVLAFVLSPVGARAAQVLTAIITDPESTDQAIVDSGGNLHVTDEVSVDSSTPSPRADPECTTVGTMRDDRLRGTRRDDVICSLRGDDVVYAGEGNDTLILGTGADWAKGGRGDDVIRGGADDDSLLFGAAGNDRIYGQGGSDHMVDLHGVDLLSGGADDDWCMNAGDGEGGDVIRGGPGRDRFSADDGDRVFSVERRVPSC